MAQSSARVRGSVAIRIVGELITRLAGGESWDFAAFARDESVLVAGSSGHLPDVAALRDEVRVQRFAGTVLPHVSTPLASEKRRALFVIFGEFGHRVAVLRVVRPAGQKPYGARDGVGIEGFFRQHADAIAAAVFEVDGAETERVAARRAAPIVFTIDQRGALLATSDEPDGEFDTNTLRAHLEPRNGEIPPVLRAVIDELLERHHAGAPAGELVAVLPFAIVRLTRMRARPAPATLIVTVEWLRSRASLEATAAQYSVSKRELQVLSAMLRGASVAAIAAELSISESTVVFHLKRMLKKTLSKNRTELAARMLGYEISA